jgi:uncharacterized membrane protein YedE/YeeE
MVASVTAADAVLAPETVSPVVGRRTLVPYLLVGVGFGVVLLKSEAISWFRIQEMFRFQAVHMFGILGTAVATAALALRIVRTLGARTRDGAVFHLEPKRFDTGWRYPLGGICFGVGWALVGACPGPMFVLLGSGLSVMAVAIVAALAGTTTYGLLRRRLPH